MTYNDIKHLKGKKFTRATGLKEAVFLEMTNLVLECKRLRRKSANQGSNATLSIEDQVLMTILYWREYRSQENLGLDFHISQSRVSRIITDIENILIQSGQFSIPGKSALKNSQNEYEVVIVDVTETPIERPKKNKSANIAVKRSVIHLKA
jgi:hypothetical protein